MEVREQDVAFEPNDWPKTAMIDLRIHDLPHASSDTEWWYFNAHLITESGEPYSLFTCFFIKKEPNLNQKYACSALFALSDINKKKYYTFSCVDKNSPQICLEQLKNLNEIDPSLKLAFEEVLKENKVPAKNHLLIDQCFLSQDKFKLEFGDLIVEKKSNDYYYLTLNNTPDNIRCDLVFIPKKLPMRQGKNGSVSGVFNEKMFYYFIPRCEVSGTIHSTRVTGQGWYDHEFGIETENKLSLETKTNWLWMSIQLENNYEVSVYLIYDANTKNLKQKFITVIESNGKQSFYNDAICQGINDWKSFETFCVYQNQWKLQISEIELELEISAIFDEQEYITFISFPAFWEGRCQVEGSFKGKTISGIAYVEQTHSMMNHTIENFLSSVSEEVEKGMDSLIPLQPTEHQLINLIASQKNKHYVEHINNEQITRTLISPIRTISDRAGKRWRSFALAACCNIVGGDFRTLSTWLAVPELMHTGSLIIDDIQDKSLVRRGGPACHVIYGEPQAINAGTAAYGLFHIILKQTPLSTEDRCKLYELYFDTYRAAHVGQAIDIDGHLPSLIECFNTKNFKLLQNQILAAHRLKSAVAPACLARMGAILGQGDDTQIDILSQFFENLGLAFQIVDDVLNARGFKNNYKLLGEDIANGKVTYPIAKSLEFLNEKDAAKMCHILKNHSNNKEDHQYLLNLLETSGSLSSCSDEAKKMIDKAWGEVNLNFPESHTKLMLRAFSSYVITRHY